jgi:uncharacterized protein (TIGR02996 family)
MSTETGFLLAIRETPDDDTPRLVYADWLDDNGDSARANFIRLQCQAARLGEADLRRQVPDALARALLLAHRDTWEAGWPRWIRQDCRFERGFAEKLETRAQTFLKSSLSQAPQFHRLQLAGVAGQIEALARCPSLARITELVLHLGEVRGVGLAPLLRSRHLTSLRRLEVHGWFAPEDLADIAAASLSGLQGLLLRQTGYRVESAIRAADLAAILDSPYLAGLESLSLLGYWLNDEGEAAALSDRLALPGLRELTWQVGRIGVDGVRALVTKPQRSRLTRLVLGHAGLSDEGAALVASSGHLEGLKQLSLDTNGIEAEGAEALAARQWSRLDTLTLSGNVWLRAEGAAALGRMSCLRSLDLSRCGLGVGGAEVIASSPDLSRLASLSLAHNAIGVDGAAALVSSQHLEGLEALNLSNCMLDLNGVRALASSGPLSRLTALDLADAFRGDAAGSAGVEALLRSPLMARLQFLGLRDNGITDAGVWVLANAPDLVNLLILDLSSNKISAAGAEALQHTGHLANLRRLVLTGNAGIGKVVGRALQTHFAPHCEVLCRGE